MSPKDSVLSTRYNLRYYKIFRIVVPSTNGSQKNIENYFGPKTGDIKN